MLVTASEMIMLARLAQPLKAPPPMVVTELGIVMLARLAHV